MTRDPFTSSFVDAPRSFWIVSQVPNAIFRAITRLVVTNLEPNLVPKWPYLVPTFYFVQSLCTAASIKVNIKVHRSHTFRPDIWHEQKYIFKHYPSQPAELAYYPVSKGRPVKNLLFESFWHFTGNQTMQSVSDYFGNGDFHYSISSATGATCAAHHQLRHWRFRHAAQEWQHIPGARRWRFQYRTKLPQTQSNFAPTLKYK